MCRTFWMISRIFNTFNSGSLRTLTRICQVLHRVFRCICISREPLRTCRLTSTVSPNFCGVGSHLVKLGFKVALQFGGAFVLLSVISACHLGPLCVLPDL